MIDELILGEDGQSENMLDFLSSFYSLATKIYKNQNTISSSIEPQPDFPSNSADHETLFYSGDTLHLLLK